MLGILVDHTYVVFGDQVFQLSVVIPMGTNCAPLLSDLFWYSYKAEFVQKLFYGTITKKKKKKLAVSFNHANRYIDDVLKLIRYQFWCTRCAFRLIKSPQWYWDRKSWKFENKIVKTVKEPKTKYCAMKLSQIRRRIELLHEGDIPSF
jgi:hypothetical protein